MSTEIPEQRDTALESFWLLWRRRRWLALGVFTLAFAAAASFIYSLPDIYSSSATVMINPDLIQDPANTGPVTSPDDVLDSVSQSVMSRSRLTDLITRFDLYPQLRLHDSMETALTRMRNDIRLERLAGQDQWGQGRVFAFTLSYQGWDPETVARVTNALASSYVDENNKLRATRATEAGDSLAMQLTQIKQKLDSQALAVNAFESSHMGELPQQEAANLAALQQLNTTLQQSISNEMLAEGRGAAAPSDAQTADLPQLEQQLAALRTRYTDKYPDVVRLEGQIAALKRAEANGGGKAVSASTPAGQENGGYYSAEQKRLRAEIAIYQQRIDNIPLVSQQMQSLTQGYNETQELYSSLLKRYEQARLSQDPKNGVGGGYRVMEPALPLNDAAGPARLRLLIMALVLCLGAAVGAVFIAEQFDTSFHSLDELRLYTRVPVLANIPRIVTTGDIWRRRVRLGTVALSLVVALCLVAGTSHFLAQGNEHVVWMLSRHHA